MSCYHPIVCYYKPGEKISFKPFKTGILDKDFKKISIGCGKCIGCKLDHSREWISRLLMEYEYNKECYFLTLTYNDENVPVSLQKSHCQKFIKRLRNTFDFLNVKYFICGEYGEKTYRPHYHAIIFGVDFLNPNIFKPKKYDNNNHFYSDKLNDLWSFGYVIYAKANSSNIGYTTRYTYKKVGTDKKLKDFGLQDTFLLCSHKLGLDYFLKNKDEIINRGCLYFNGQQYSIPRYFLKKLEVIDGESLKKIKRRNEIKANKMAASYSLVDLGKQELLKKLKLKFLKRNQM